MEQDDDESDVVDVISSTNKQRLDRRRHFHSIEDNYDDDFDVDVPSLRKNLKKIWIQKT